MKILKLNYLFVAVLFIALYGCGKDDDNDPVGIDVTDPNAVTEALTFAGVTSTTLKTGTLPGPSDGDDAPALEDIEGLGVGFSGTHASIYIEETTESNLLGVFLQIEGASQYFDIVLGQKLHTETGIARMASALRGGSNLFWETPTYLNNIFMSLPEDLLSGTFCVRYCVYDKENRVSNVVEGCLEVQSFEESELNLIMTNVWEMESKYEQEVQSNEIRYDTTILAGETYTYTYEEYFGCEENPYIDVTDAYRTNYSYMLFANNSGVFVEESLYKKELFFSLSDCENGAAYLEETNVEAKVGAWEYNDSKKTLLVFFEEGDEYIVYDVAWNENKLILSNKDVYEPGTYVYTEITLKPKN